MYEIIAIIIAAFRTDAAEDFLRAELAPYIDNLSKFSVVLPVIATVTSLLMRSAGQSATTQAEVNLFITKLGDVLHDLSEPRISSENQQVVAKSQEMAGSVVQTTVDNSATNAQPNPWRVTTNAQTLQVQAESVKVDAPVVQMQGTITQEHPNVQEDAAAEVKPALNQA